MYPVKEMQFYPNGSYCVSLIEVHNVGWGVISPDSEHVKGIMQSTGLLDSEGDKIYESDIVGVFMDRLGDSYPNFKENDYMVCEVIFENGGFHAVNFNKEMQFPLWAVAKEALIKLGNIYENPDRLK